MFRSLRLAAIAVARLAASAIVGALGAYVVAFDTARKNFGPAGGWVKAEVSN